MCLSGEEARKCHPIEKPNPPMSPSGNPTLAWEARGLGRELALLSQDRHRLGRPRGCCGAEILEGDTVWPGQKRPPSSGSSVNGQPQPSGLHAASPPTCMQPRLWAE